MSTFARDVLHRDAVQCVGLWRVPTVYTGHRSDNFIVGFTNVSPLDSTPILWKYTLCGQYPGAVPAGATVSLYCPYNLPLFRYVIVQFPMIDRMNICELEVMTPGTWREIYHCVAVLLTDVSYITVCGGESLTEEYLRSPKDLRPRDFTVGLNKVLYILADRTATQYDRLLA